jgi:hypothetical protein
MIEECRNSVFTNALPCFKIPHEPDKFVLVKRKKAATTNRDRPPLSTINYPLLLHLFNVCHELFRFDETDDPVVLQFAA